VAGATLHGYGLGRATRDVSIRTDQLAGQSTFVMEGGAGGGGSSVTLKIVDVVEELSTVMLARGVSQLDILHVNCEGCEWELFLRLAETASFGKIAVIQVSFHNYGVDGIGALVPKYCVIRDALLKTHTPVAVLPFGWERWVRK